MAPRQRQDEAKMALNLASNLALFQEASKTPPDLDFHRFWTLPGGIFESILMIFSTSSFYKIT